MKNIFLLGLDLNAVAVLRRPLRHPVNHLGHERPQLLLLQVRRLHDLLVVGFLVRVLFEDAFVGDEGEGEDGHLAMSGHQNLRDGAHA